MADALALVTLALVWALVLLPPLVQRRRHRKLEADPAVRTRRDTLVRELSDSAVFGDMWTSMSTSQRRDAIGELLNVPDTWPELDQALAAQPQWAQAWWAFTPSERRATTLGFAPYAGLPFTRGHRTRRMLIATFGPASP